MNRCRTFVAQIWCGLRISYRDESATYEEVQRIIQKYVDEIGWCVTIRKVEYIYKEGSELGVVVGIINYPRFPTTRRKLRKQTLELAQRMKDGLYQNRLSVVFPRKTIMLGDIKDRTSHANR